MVIPQLLYHALSATLYPTNTPNNLLAVRFSTAVRVSSIRIIPEGVRCFDGVGTTCPSAFDADVLFNISPSNPVNAMVKSRIAYKAAPHAVDYRVDMPESVSTRLVIVRCMAERLSLSIYGCVAGEPEQETGTTRVDLENLSSVEGEMEWDIGTLLDTIEAEDHSVILDVLAQADPTIYGKIVRHPKALAYLRSDPDGELVKRMLAIPEYGDALALETDGSEWDRFEMDVDALYRLRHAGWKEILKGDRLARLLLMAESQEAALGPVLEMLKRPPEEDQVLLAFLAEKIPRLTTIWLTRQDVHGKRKYFLELPMRYRRKILGSLVCASMEIVDGRSCFPAAQVLAQPYLAGLVSSDPLFRFFCPDLDDEPEAGSATLSTPISTDTNAEDQRSLDRLATALSSPSFSSSSIIHTATASQLIHLLAPALYASLSTAPVPPFGIPAIGILTPESQASNYGGKVYTSHEFRERGKKDVGLGILMRGTSAGAVGRPASRHVDEYSKV
ncbi:hypothetical protein P7C73_g195, partial [Tremellales sp. Uapishka_1]